MRARDPVVHELVAHRLPRRAAVVRALDQLPEPTAGLRRVQPGRVGRGPLDVVDLPAREVRPADLPPLPRAVRGHDERALARPHQHPYAAHPFSLRIPCTTTLGEVSRNYDPPLLRPPAARE